MDHQIILQYFPDFTDQQIDQFKRLGPLYKEWNDQINVISRKDIDELYIRHVLHSLAIYKEFQFLPGSRILDIGTGGGFPGIPLAIAHPEVEFVLVDSIGKKIKVVNEVAQALGLKNVTGIHARVEEIEGKFDFIVSRAVARIEKLLKWVDKKVAVNHKHPYHNGIILLKGGDLSEEIKEGRRKAQVFDLTDFYKEDFFETKKIVYLPF